MSGKAVRETLGFLGVIASLVFVGMEVRGNTVAARAAAYQVMGVELSSLWHDWSMDPEMTDLRLRDRAGQELTEGETEQVNNIMSPDFASHIERELGLTP